MGIRSTIFRTSVREVIRALFTPLDALRDPPRASVGSDSEQRPRDHSGISRGDPDQVAFRHGGKPAHPRSEPATSLADMREAPLDRPALLAPWRLALLSAHSTTIAVNRFLLPVGPRDPPALEALPGLRNLGTQFRDFEIPSQLHAVVAPVRDELRDGPWNRTPRRALRPGQQSPPRRGPRPS